jgi:hypothetical protein
MKASHYISVLLFLFLFLNSCSSNFYSFRSNYHYVNQLIHDNAKEKLYLKAHLKNGDVCIMKDAWSIDTVRNAVAGYGIRYNYNRRLITANDLVIPVDSVAIFETNKPLKDTEKGRIGALTILASADAILGLICLTNPKACFGSCPTFYTGTNQDIHYANAEGFSSSIVPSMEKPDIDALDITVRQRDFSITMKNEALETHCVKDVKLLACPLNPGEHVYQTNHDLFYSSNKVYSLQQALAPEGDITALLATNDKHEWVSLSDKNDLAAREDVLLDYGYVRSDEPLALNISFRQSFLSTYLFYSTMGYMGNEVGTYFAKIETDKKTRDFVNGMYEKCGGIDIFVWNEKTDAWDYQDTFNEKGPIAFNDLIMPLKTEERTGSLKIKLHIGKGSWKLDYAAVVNMKEELKPIAISAERIMKKGKEDTVAKACLNDSKEHLISMPGDVYKFSFALPSETTDYQLFLYTKGYYLEWMRDHWLKDKNLLSLKQMRDNPARFLKREAPHYKRYEREMNDLFWGSRINTVNE